MQYIIDYINSKGGALGKKFELVPFDNKSQPSDALIALKSATDQNMPFIMQCSGSNIAAALIDGVNKHNERNPDNRIIYLNCGAVAPELTNQQCSFWHFRFDLHAGMKAEVMVPALPKDTKKVYLINQDYLFGQSVQRKVKNDLDPDAALLRDTRFLEAVATQNEIASVKDNPDAKYEVPASDPVVLTNAGIPLDEVEDLLLESAAYRQAARVLLPKLGHARGRPLTPLHGGHVGLLCTAGMLNGVFGEGEDRHIAHWRSIKFTDHWEEEEEDGSKILHDRERFSHELTLVFADGRTKILTHEKKEET